MSLISLTGNRLIHLVPIFHFIQTSIQSSAASIIKQSSFLEISARSVIVVVTFNIFLDLFIYIKIANVDTDPDDYTLQIRN